MKLKILEVDKDSYAIGPNEIKSWTYNIRAKTSNGLELEIFDINGIDLRKYLNKYVECLIEISACEIDDDSEFIIVGKYIHDHFLPSKWKGIYENYDIEKSYSAVKTDYGIFLLDSKNYTMFKEKDGEIVEFAGFGMNLEAFMLIN